MSMERPTKAQWSQLKVLTTFSFCLNVWRILSRAIPLCSFLNLFSKQSSFPFYLLAISLTMLSLSFAIIFLVCGHSLATYKPLRLDEFKPRRSQLVDTKFSLFCSPQEGTPPFRYTWYKNGRVIALTGVNHRVETSPDNSVLIINKLTVSDATNYSCTVVNDLKQSDTQYTILSVKGRCGCIFVIYIFQQSVAHWFSLAVQCFLSLTIIARILINCVCFRLVYQLQPCSVFFILRCFLYL